MARTGAGKQAVQKLRRLKRDVARGGQGVAQPGKILRALHIRGSLCKFVVCSCETARYVWAGDEHWEGRMPWTQSD